MTKQKCQRKIFKWIFIYCNSRVFIENLRVAFKTRFGLKLLVRGELNNLIFVIGCYMVKI